MATRKQSDAETEPQSIKSPKRARPKPPKDDWDTLFTLINAYTEAAIGDSWKGGGDPEKYEVYELRFKLAHAQLNYHIRMMKAKLT